MDVEDELLDGIKQRNKEVVCKAVESSGGACLQNYLSKKLKYKGREGQGDALCWAILSYEMTGLGTDVSKSASSGCPDGDCMVEYLLELKASVDSRLQVTVKSHEQVALAIHVAAGVGIPKILKLLLTKHADPNAKVRIDNKAIHYTALHDAVWNERAEAIGMLLQHRASPDVVNKDNETPLHLVAKLGKTFNVKDASGKPVHVAKALRMSDATLKDAVEVALENSRYPLAELLHLVDQFSFKDLAKVVNREQRRAALMVKADATGNWVTCIRQAARGEGDEGYPCDASVLIDFLRTKPDSAAVLIDACTVEPSVMDTRRHPLPQRSTFLQSQRSWTVPFACYLSKDTSWTWNESDEGSYPPWHENFQHKPQLGEEIEVRLLLIAGVVDPWVFKALSLTENSTTLQKLSVQALLRYGWFQEARAPYVAEVVNDLIVLAVLMLWSLRIVPVGDSTRGLQATWAYRSACWCHPMTIAIKRCVMELIQVAKSLQKRHFRDYILARGNVADWTFMITLGLLCLMIDVDGSGPMITKDWAHQWDFLAACSFLRWLKVMIDLRGVLFMGKDIMCFIQTIFDFVLVAVLLLLYMGFTQAFWALRTEDASASEVMVWSVRLLFLGEWQDDLVDSTKTRSPVLSHILVYTAVLAFCIGFLNLFIALISDIYAKAKEKGEIWWLQQRAQICAQVMLQPRLPASFGCLRRRFGSLACAATVYGLGATLFLSYFFFYSGVLVPVLVWLATLMLAEACLMSESREAELQKQRLWFSYPKGAGEAWWYPELASDCPRKSSSAEEEAPSFKDLTRELRKVSKAMKELQTRSEAQERTLKELRQLTERSGFPTPAAR